MKPDNVFIVNDEEEDVIKVLDFGVAKAIGGTFGEEGGNTRTGALLGTPYYMSPEQAQGDRQIDHRSDLWSLGVIAFQCLTGRLPFESEGLGSLVLKICTGPIPRPSEICPVPAGFDDWFARALVRDPDGRFQSAKEMSASLRFVLTGEEATGQRNWLSADASAPLASPGPLQASSSADNTGPYFARVVGASVDRAPGADFNLTTGQAAAAEVMPNAPSRAGLGWLWAIGAVFLTGMLAVGVGLILFLRYRAPAPPDPVSDPAISAPAPVEVAPEVEPSTEPSAVPTSEPESELDASPAPIAATEKPVVARPAIATPKPVATTPAVMEPVAAKPPEPKPKPPATASSKGRLGF